MTIAEKLTRTNADIDAVYEAGKSQGDGDEFVSFKNMDSINYFFTSNTNSYYFDKLDKLDLSNIKRAQYTFQDTTTITEVKLSLPNVVSINGMFRRCSNAVKVELNIPRISAMTDVFCECTSLKEIIKPLDFSNTRYTSRTFDSCGELEKISFTGSIIVGFDIHWSTKLTAESLESIVTHLSDSVTGQTITLPTTAQANYDAVKGSGTWATLIAPITNWTFAYA